MNLRIKDICKEQGILMKDLAQKLGMTEVGLSKSLNGNPTIGRLQEIADILRVEITELFSPASKGLSGHIEYKGTIYRINSFEDLEKILKLREE